MGGEGFLKSPAGVAMFPAKQMAESGAPFSLAMGHICAGLPLAHLVPDMQPDALFAEIAKQAEQGVDFITVHCGLSKRGAEMAVKNNRVLGIVSRGGSMTRQEIYESKNIFTIRSWSWGRLPYTRQSEAKAMAGVE